MNITNQKIIKGEKYGFKPVSREQSYILNTIIPSGKGIFHQAYAYGIGMMLSFHDEYMSTQTNEENNEKLKVPSYLHFVIASEDPTSSVSENDIAILQHR